LILLAARLCLVIFKNFIPADLTVSGFFINRLVMPNIKSLPGIFFSGKAIRPQIIFLQANPQSVQLMV
jgi:hypothetical protein